MGRGLGTCQHCRRTVRLDGPLCAADLGYRRRHGVLPPPAVLAARAARQQPGTCRNCGRATQPYHRKGGRCPTCAVYWYAMHTERPAALWGREMTMTRRRRPGGAVALPAQGCPACGDAPVLPSGYCSRACAIAAELGA